MHVVEYSKTTFHVHIRKLQPFSPKKSWERFCNKAFRGKYPIEPEETSYEIAIFFLESYHIQLLPLWSFIDKWENLFQVEKGESKSYNGVRAQHTSTQCFEKIVIKFNTIKSNSWTEKKKKRRKKTKSLKRIRLKHRLVKYVINTEET